jgi:hypothetical protein
MAIDNNDVSTRIGEAIGQLYLVRGLLAGGALLVARARLTTPQDKRLRREALRLAKEAGEACAGGARAVDVVDVQGAATAGVNSFLAVAEGHLRAAIAQLDAMEARHETDEALQAFDLLHLAADTLKAAGRNLTRAFDVSSRRHAGAAA